MIPFARSISTAAMLIGVVAPLSAQTPQIHATPLPSGRIGIQFPTHSSPVPGRPVELRFDVTPLPPAPASPPRSLRSATCATAPALLDQSGDSKMVVRGLSPGAPPVEMPGSGQPCHESFPAAPASP